MDRRRSDRRVQDQRSRSSRSSGRQPAGTNRRGSRRRRRLRFEPNRNFFIILGSITAAAIAVVLYLLLAQNLVTVEKGAIPFAEQGTGVIIRTEKLYQAENYGKAVFLASEGQRAEIGTAIADVYSWDYNDSVVNSLKTLQDKIMDYQKNNLLKGILNQDLATYDQSIEAKSDEIRSVIAGETDGELQKLEQELKELMNERVNFLNESVKVDEQLQTYYDSESALKARIDGWKETITAEAEGLVSFYFDGSETLLAPENMTKLSSSQIKDILDGKSFYTLDSSSASRPLYRLVDEHTWYAVYMSDHQIEEFNNDNVFTVTFGDEQTKYSAKVTERRQDGGSYLYYLSFSDSVEELLLARRVEMSISNDYLGLLVPQDAVTEQDGQTGVMMKQDDKKQFVAVKVLIIRDGQCIIEPVDLKSSLGEGSQIYH